MKQYKFTKFAAVIGFAVAYTKYNFNIFGFVHHLLNSLGFAMTSHHDVMEATILFLLITLVGLLLDRRDQKIKQEYALIMNRQHLALKQQSNRELLQITEEMFAIMNKFVLSADTLNPDCVNKIDGIVLDISDRVVDIRKKLDSFKTK